MNIFSNNCLLSIFERSLTIINNFIQVQIIYYVETLSFVAKKTQIATIDAFMHKLTQTDKTLKQKWAKMGKN